MNDALDITLLQTELHWSDVAANLAQFSRLLDGCGERSELVILPEVFSTGFGQSKDFVRSYDSLAAIDWMLEMACRHQSAICGSVIHKIDEGFVNRCLFATPDGELQHYDKVHLFRMANEHQRYRPGKRRVVVEWRGWKILLTVCYDLRFPVFMRNRVLNGKLEYDLAICVANWPAARADAWSSLLKARAIENLCYVAGVNRVGVDGNGLEYSGDSALIDFRGRYLIDGAGGDAMTVSARIDKPSLTKFRREFPAHLDADDFDLRIKS